LLQNDTGSALVYSVFILVLYREGLPAWVLSLLVWVVLLFIFTLLSGVEFVTIFILTIGIIYFFLYIRNLKTVLLAIAVLLFFYTLFYGLDYYFQLALSNFIKLFLPFFISVLIFLYYAFRQNIKRIYAVLVLASVSLLFIFSVDYVFNHVLIQHQRDRINNLLGIEFDPLGAGYNVNQSLIAIGSGNLFGKGFLQGTQTKYDFVPEQSTDFIFCTVGEEWGFVGTSVVLLLFLFLLIRIIIIAERQRSRFTRIYAYGVASIFFFHIIINVGMTIGLAPVIGIPLPFFSYGGSSFWAFTILLFILLRLDVSRDELLN
jgi:rod shape determining protein RodA